jgi:predicted amidohydrolase
VSKNELNTTFDTFAAMKVKVAAIQCACGTEKSFKSAEKLISKANDQECEIVLLPEYFSYKVGDTSLETSFRTIDWLEKVSREYSMVVAGNALMESASGRGYINSLHIFDRGELVGVQEKLHPTKSERELGIECGKELKVFDVRGVKIAGLICADILYPEICRVAALKGAEIVLNPVVSFKRSELPSSNLRYCLYFTRSFDNAYGIIKAGGVGYTFLGEETVGRSVIVSHEGILAKYSSETDEELVMATMDIESIRAYKNVNYSLTDRNVRAYEELLKNGIC